MGIGRRRGAGAGAGAFGGSVGVAVVGAVTVVALAAGCSPQDSGGSRADRQGSVAERGESVMPFDLERTTHRFTATATGGVQDVVADRRGDTRQIDLIRVHLREEAEAFGRGDFGDPAAIHGADMPGLAELRAGHDRIEVRYTERTDGATLTYTTRDSALVDALHDWFAAQLGDHGAHAESGHGSR
ncbi:aspartate carbamoyltransferase [Streptomyces roseicoloratus]|uniref:aspartate carbamoyltransferase n=1 Tax=Streptomyces roseicoloratus TaxID=2508722 RepID=UPI0010099531|nr:aspartate carbamoyltransferase [Streptomyces roseicoloratus]